MAKKVCFIINTLTGGGGAERTVQNLSNKYASQGMEVTIILVDELKVGYKLDSNVHVKTIDFKNNSSKNIFSYIKKMNELGKFIKEQKFDYVFSFLFRSNVVNIITSRIFNLSPIIISERSFSVENYKEKNIKNYLTKFLLRHIYLKADAIIAISQGVKDSLVKDFSLENNKIKVIYNPVAKYHQYPIKKIQSKNAKGLNLITVGRLIDSKNQRELIKAVKILHDLGIKANLKILGEGPLKSELTSLISSYKLDKSVELLGFKPNLRDYLEDSDIFIFASKYEAFGNVILEAMQVGLPIISYQTKGGPTEIIQDNKYGIIISENKPEKMAEEIIKINKDCEKYEKYSALSIKRASDFSIDKISDEYLKVFDKSKLVKI
ncbi:glycosyltransferase [Mesobacillus foraminis]|uniref:glycosyltransferase n=1 Tax=Mesobacillus foraminis TaxID=279826 RepID=UPI00399FC84F